MKKETTEKAITAQEDLLNDVVELYMHLDEPLAGYFAERLERAAEMIGALLKEID